MNFHEVFIWVVAMTILLNLLLLHSVSLMPSVFGVLVFCYVVHRPVLVWCAPSWFFMVCCAPSCPGLVWCVLSWAYLLCNILVWSGVHCIELSAVLCTILLWSGVACSVLGLSALQYTVYAVLVWFGMGLYHPGMV